MKNNEVNLLYPYTVAPPLATIPKKLIIIYITKLCYNDTQRNLLEVEKNDRKSLHLRYTYFHNQYNVHHSKTCEGSNAYTSLQY